MLFIIYRHNPTAEACGFLNLTSFLPSYLTMRTILLKQISRFWSFSSTERCASAGTRTHLAYIQVCMQWRCSLSDQSLNGGFHAQLPMAFTGVISCPNLNSTARYIYHLLDFPIGFLDNVRFDGPIYSAFHWLCNPIWIQLNFIHQNSKLSNLGFDYDILFNVCLMNQ